jgi:hypothetical protein
MFCADDICCSRSVFSTPPHRGKEKKKKKKKKKEEREFWGGVPLASRLLLLKCEMQF